jgi:tRNA-splicing ligase RtcB/release factor H-coupled RctB family protein
MSRGSLLVRPAAANMVKGALYSCSHGAGRRLSRFDAMKYWRTVLKEKERKAYKMRFSELLGRNGEFPNGYIQEFDFAYKDSTDILKFQPFLKKVTQTTPIVTVKYTEI